MSFYRSFLAAFIGGLLILTPSLSLAAPANPGTPPPEVFIPGPDSVPPDPDGSPELSSCFDYYRFGSTPITIRGDVSTVSQGGTITFVGTITNENDYPVINAGIYGKIMHKWTDTKSSFGPNVVDWFTVQEGLVLKAGESKPIAFSWQVPQNSEPGEYRLAMFVAASERFNLAGLSFTSDVIGGQYNFKVAGEPGTTKLDIKNVVLGDQVVHSAAFSPQINSDENVPITVSVVNSSKKNFKGGVKWKLYLWDGLREDRLLDEKVEAVEVPADGMLTSTYIVKPDTHTVHYVLAELVPADAKDAKSFIAARFVSGQYAEPRINFVGVSKYPASGATFFTCVHSTGRTQANNVRVEMSARPLNPLAALIPGSTFAEKTYEGTVQGAISALTVPIEKAPGSFLLSAKIYQDGNLVDQVEVPYTCDQLGGECDDDTMAPIAIAGVIVLILILGILWLLLRRKTQPSSGIMTK